MVSTVVPCTAQSLSVVSSLQNNGDSSETARRSGFRRRYSVHSSEDVAADGEHMDSFARLALRRKSDPGVGNVPHAGTSQGSPLNPNSDGRDSSPGEMRREGSHHGRLNPESPDFLAAAASNNTSRFDRHMCNTSAEQGSWSLSPSFIKDAGLQRDSSPLGQSQASSGDCRRTGDGDFSERRSSEALEHSCSMPSPQSVRHDCIGQSECVTFARRLWQS